MTTLTPTMPAAKRPSPRRKRRAKVRFNPLTPTYLTLVEQMERRRRERGWTHLRLAAEAGIGATHWAHYLSPDASAGRVMVWATLDKVFQALFAEGFHIVAVEPLNAKRATHCESEAAAPQGFRVAQVTSSDP